MKIPSQAKKEEKRKEKKDEGFKLRIYIGRFKVTPWLMCVILFI